MKRTITIFALLVLTAVFAKAQDTLAGWTFPTGTLTDANPDFRNANNISMAITADGGTSAIDFTKNGITTKSAQATGWDGGANLKCWQIELNTTGYDNLKLNSLQTSGGANPGPRDFIVQYKVGSAGIWTDVSGTTIVTANNWTSGVVNNVDIPAACNDQPSVFIRWIMTSDTSSAPPALVLPTGTAKIDNIFVTGTAISTGTTEFQKNDIAFYPNPAAEVININCPAGSEFKILSLDGQLLKNGLLNSQTIYVSELNNGIYFLEIKRENEIFVKKLIIQ